MVIDRVDVIYFLTTPYIYTYECISTDADWPIYIKMVNFNKHIHNCNKIETFTTVTIWFCIKSCLNHVLCKKGKQLN